MEELASLEVEGKAFRVQNQRILLTYKENVAEETIRKMFSEDKCAIRVEIAHEQSDSVVPYSHTHVYVDFGRAFASRNRKIFDIGSMHPYIQKVDRNQEETVFACLARQDPENVKLVEERITINKLPNRKREIIIGTKNFNVPNLTLYPWQKELEELINQPPELGKILWYFHNNGGGKTTFANWLNHIYFPQCLILETLKKTSEIMMDLETGIANGWTGEILIIDLPRNEQRGTNYDNLTSLRNGKMRHKGKTIKWSGKFVIVFASVNPDTDETSWHQWDIRVLKLVGKEKKFIAEKHNPGEFTESRRQIDAAKEQYEQRSREKEELKKLEIEEKRQKRERIIWENKKARGQHEEDYF